MDRLIKNLMILTVILLSLLTGYTIYQQFRSTISADSLSQNYELLEKIKENQARNQSLLVEQEQMLKVTRENEARNKQIMEERRVVIAEMREQNKQSMELRVANREAILANMKTALAIENKLNKLSTNIDKLLKFHDLKDK